MLLSASTAALIGDTMALEKAGSTTLRGFAEPIDIYRVSGEFTPKPDSSLQVRITGGAL